MMMISEVPVGVMVDLTAADRRWMNDKNDDGNTSGEGNDDGSNSSSTGSEGDDGSSDSDAGGESGDSEDDDSHTDDGTGSSDTGSDTGSNEVASESSDPQKSSHLVTLSPNLAPVVKETNKPTVTPLSINTPTITAPIEDTTTLTPTPPPDPVPEVGSLTRAPTTDNNKKFQAFARPPSNGAAVPHHPTPTVHIQHSPTRFQHLPPGLPKPPPSVLQLNHYNNNNTNNTTEMTLNSSTMPVAVLLLLLLLLLLLAMCCCCGIRRSCQRAHDLDTSRGEYRRVTSRFTADAFDDTIQDIMDDDDDDDDDDEYGNHPKGTYANGKIELQNLDRGKLSLKEING